MLAEVDWFQFSLELLEFLAWWLIIIYVCFQIIDNIGRWLAQEDHN